jgi:hypothetical protein
VNEKNVLAVTRLDYWSSPRSLVCLEDLHATFTEMMFESVHRPPRWRHSRASQRIEQAARRRNRFSVLQPSQRSLPSEVSSLVLEAAPTFRFLGGS